MKLSLLFSESSKVRTPWLFHELFSAVYPPQCRVCGRYTRDSILCRRCVPPLEVTQDYWEISGHGSERFLPPLFVQVISLYRYRGVVRHLIKRIKFDPDKALLHAWQTYLFKEIPLRARLQGIEAVTWVPSHRENHIRRDFDPSEIFAQGLSRHSALPPGCPLLVRDAQLPAQSQLLRTARIKNASSLFRARRELIPRRLLLVDDVISTGATVRGAATALHVGGAHEITVVSLARNIR